MRAQQQKTSNRLSLTIGICASLLSIVVAGSFSHLAAQSELKIGIIGDQSSTPNLQQSYQVLAKGVEILSRENIACALHTGDLLESTASPDQIRVQFAQATAILDQLGRAWHLTAGDHDVNPPVFQQDSTDRSRETLYRELYRQREPKLTDTLNHSFDVKGYHFISLNSQEHLHTDPRWGDVFLDKISPQQLDWLKDDLEKHRDAQGIVVFLHQPMWYYWSNWKPVHELLRRYRVIAVVAGHFHYDQDEGELDNIRYVVVGSTGGIIKQGSRDAGSVQHVTVMTIRGLEVDFRLIPTDGSAPLRLTPRVDMDRVQAVALVLGELFSFGGDNPICLRGDQLFRNNTEPATLALVPIGNPIDLPITIEVQLTAEKFALIDPQFTTGICREVTAGGACILPPASRIESSNTSSVVLNNRFAPLPPLWQSGLAIKSGSTVAVGDPVTLKVRMSFRGSQDNLLQETVASTTITACK
jgi:3',5'-cyclic AMP phosphodiesterase CpdA